MRFLISLCFLFCPVFASIQEDANNEIPDSLEDRSDGKELDDEATFCEAKGGCGQQSAGYVPHSPLIPCDKVYVIHVCHFDPKISSHFSLGGMSSSNVMLLST